MPLDIATAGVASWASSTATFYINYPATVNSFDLLVMQVMNRGTVVTPTVSASWTNIAAADSTTIGRQWLYYRWGTTTFSGSSTTVGIATATMKGGRIYRFAGVATASTVFEGGQFMTSNTSSMTCGEVTATAASFTNLGVAAYFITDDALASTFSGAVGASWTKIYQASSTLGSDGAIGIQLATISAPPVTVTTASYSMAAATSWGIRTFLLIGSATIPGGVGVQPMYLYQFGLSSA